MSARSRSTSARSARNSGTIDILARTLWGEARGEARAGMVAVACVIRNRAARGAGYWWGDSIAAVCRKPWQFSCWNANDPNREKLLRVDGRDRQFRLCRRIAANAIKGIPADTTSGATHYHALDVAPAWARGKQPCARIGRHLFYNNIE